ncbi:MAG: diacylglycerol/lipid kinase family protein [Candidatus Dormibacteria bacterium]
MISTKAGSVTPEIDHQLRAAFDDFDVMEFDPKVDIKPRLAPQATVVVAGGDGTIGYYARALAGSNHRLGILSLGTYNNFARGLGMPKQLAAAIRVVKKGRVAPVTLGKVNDRYFLEAAAIGLFGDAIAMGEAAKDRAFGQLGQELARVGKATPFAYQLTGDIEGHGSALSLVFANTSSIGAQIPVGDGTPVDPYLELAVHVGESRTDIVGRLLASALKGRHAEGKLGMSFRFRRLRITTTPRVRVFVDNMDGGRTPAVIEASVGALNIILPEARRNASRLGPGKGARRP